MTPADFLRKSNLPWLSNLSQSYFDIRDRFLGRRVHVITPSFHRKDAVSKHFLETATLFALGGAEVFTYANHGRIHEEEWLATTDSLATNVQPTDVLLYHHSIGDKLLDEVVAVLPKYSGLYYHGITPPEFLDQISRETAEMCRLGYRQLKNLGSFAVIASNSKSTMGDLLKNCPDLEKSSSFVLPPVLTFDRRAYGRHADGPRDLRLVYVGRLMPHKNIESVIDVMKGLRRFDNYRLDIITSLGDSSYREFLLKKIDAEGLSDLVRFHQGLDDDALRLCVVGASALIQLSRHEGFAIPIVEAMLFGVPVVSHDAGAIAETLDGAGLLIQPGKVDFEFLHTALSHPERRAEIIRGQFRVYDRRYSDQVLVPDYIEFAEKVFGSK